MPPHPTNYQYTLLITNTHLYTEFIKHAKHTDEIRHLDSITLVQINCNNFCNKTRQNCNKTEYFRNKN